jgi:ATP-dependent protease ClpP protease subunit
MPRANNSIEHDLYCIHTYGLDLKNRELYLHSDLNESDNEEVNFKSAIVFEKNMRYLNQLSNEPILIHMHIPGGDWEDCLGIYDTIKESKSKTIILAYAKAQSASSIILQAPDLRVLMPNVNVLIHYGSISLDSEHSKAAAESVQWNEKECDKMIDIYVERCMNSDMAKDKNWKKMMAKKHIQSQLANRCDWILSAKEAVDYGFADGVLCTKEYPNIDSLKNLVKKK